VASVVAISGGWGLAVYPFVGWENLAATAEETQDPRTGVPMAVFTSIALIAVLCVFLSYSTVAGFDNNPDKLTAASVPMVEAAAGIASFLAFLAYIAGFTSIFGTLISATNSQARIIFNSGREGLLPRITGRVTSRTQTPYVAFIVSWGSRWGSCMCSGAVATRTGWSCSLARLRRWGRSS
jgi:amino acid transporter